MDQSVERMGHIAEMAGDESCPELDYLFSEGRACQFETGANIITEGEPTTYFYDLLSGTVALARNGRDGRRQILAFMGARQFLGAASTPGYPNLAVALTPVKAIRYPRSALEKALPAAPKFATNYRTVLTRILEASHDHVYTIGQRSALERLASFMLYLRAHQAKFSPNGPLEPSCHIELPMTRLDIADFLGLTIETVSRTFSSLKDKKLISFSDSHSAEILELDKIRELGGREDFTDRRGQT